MVGALWVAWAGCAWVTPLEHQRNQRDLLSPDGDADTDVDADSDADTDTDTDTATLGCIDDGYEPNQAAPADVEPGVIDGVTCPEDVDPGTDLVLDRYRIAVGPTDVLEVALDGRGRTACEDLSVTVSVRDPAGGDFPVTELDRCGDVVAGWGVGVYEVWASAPPTAGEQDYQLTLSVGTCQDDDGDGYLSRGCGGLDCSDVEDSFYPGAFDGQDGFDQDCDGGDDLEPLGCEITTGFYFAFERAECGDLATAPVWDAWTVPVLAGSTLSVVADNDAGSTADIVAIVVDADGSSHYGLSPDRSQLDDEAPCATPPWSGGGCPAACVGAASDGEATIWIAQHPGSGCRPDAAYRLLVYVDGLPAYPDPAADDVILPFPP